MFEVISIAEAYMTRFVHLRHCKNGVIEFCFYAYPVTEIADGLCFQEYSADLCTLLELAC